MTIRQKILKASTLLFPKKKPLTYTDSCISTLLCHDHVPFFIYAIQSFIYWSNIRLPLCIIEDGTLTPKDKRLLAYFFDVTIFDKITCERKMKNLLKPYPHIAAYRFHPSNEITKMKLDAYLIPPYKRIIYMDSDILFFQKPNEICTWIMKNQTTFLHLEHLRSLLKSSEREDIDFCFRTLLKLYTPHQPVSPTFNTGIVCIPNKQDINLATLNTIYKLFNRIFYSRAFTCEETSIAILFKTLPHAHFSPHTYVCPAREKEYFIAKKQHPLTMIHYINETEKFYAKDAYAFLWKYIRHTKINHS